MRDLLGLVVIVAGFAVVLVGLPVIAARVRRGRGGGSMLGPFEEIWYPAAHRARIEIEQQQEQAAPAPAPGDPPSRVRLRPP